MMEEEPAVATSDRTPVFSETARIFTVDTVEGLICTHEVSGGCAGDLVGKFLFSMKVIIIFEEEREGAKKCLLKSQK